MGTLEEVGNVYDSETWNEIRNKLHAMSELENRGKCYRDYAAERDYPDAIGWNYEGLAWYGVVKKPFEQ